MPRTPRSAETRATETRRNNKRPNLQTMFQSPLDIPAHEIPDGVTYSWIRSATLQQPDNTNVGAKYTAGWRPVPRDRHLDRFPVLDLAGYQTPNAAIIEHAGLILCEMPTKLYKERRAQITRRNAQVIQGVQNLTSGAVGAPVYDNSTPVQIERQTTRNIEGPEFQED